MRPRFILRIKCNKARGQGASLAAAVVASHTKQTDCFPDAAIAMQAIPDIVMQSEIDGTKESDRCDMQ